MPRVSIDVRNKEGGFIKRLSRKQANELIAAGVMQGVEELLRDGTTRSHVVPIRRDWEQALTYKRRSKQFPSAKFFPPTAQRPFAGSRQIPGASKEDVHS